MDDHPSSRMIAALHDFQRLRRRADVERLLARLSGQPADLLPFEEVRQRLRATMASERQLRDIPLDAIVGSVGRYHDFTRTFLPRRDSDSQRWSRVMVAADSLAGLPPIEVYQIGSAYFVVDGNHRVSVARQLDLDHISAYVIPLRSRVAISPSLTAEQLIVAGELAAFLEETRLDELRPGCDLSVTAAGQLSKLREQIAVQQAQLAAAGAPAELAEAASAWYDGVYLPLVQIIRDRGLLRDFPGRREADLYLWLCEHRAELAEQLGWEISAEQAAGDLSAGVGRVEQAIEWAIPDSLELPTPAGVWRRDRAPDPSGWIFREALVPISGDAAGWAALDQLLAVARNEPMRLLGLHVVRSAAERAGPAAQAVAASFAERCAAAGARGQCAIEVGPVGRAIRERTRWADLLALQINYPPGPSPLARLTSSLRTIIRSSVRPVLTVPRAVERVERLLLAYDGSPKAEEALFLATYLAGRWRLALTVTTVIDGKAGGEAARIRARAYLERNGVSADYAVERGEPAAAIIHIAEVARADVLIMGGHTARDAVSDLVIGSTTEELLRARRMPTLICQ